MAPTPTIGKPTGNSPPATHESNSGICTLFPKDDGLLARATCRLTALAHGQLPVGTTSVSHMDEQTDYDSLDEAIERYGIPLENRSFVHRIPATIPLSRFGATSGYIRADRAAGGPQLNISFGWTNGFISRDEVVAVFGDVDCWESPSRAPLWGVSHPLNRMREGSETSIRSVDRDYGTCEIHHLTLSASGACPSCE